MSATAWFILATLLVVVAYDFWADFDPEESGGTISNLIRSIGKRWALFAPLVAFAMGCLFGHFFL